MERRHQECNKNWRPEPRTFLAWVSHKVTGRGGRGRSATRLVREHRPNSQGAGQEPACYPPLRTEDSVHRHVASRRERHCGIECPWGGAGVGYPCPATHLRHETSQNLSMQGLSAEQHSKKQSPRVAKTPNNRGRHKFLKGVAENQFAAIEDL